SKYRSKKAKTIKEKQKVVQYDKYSKPSFLLQYSDLLKYIHDLIKYRLADVYRCKEAIKQRHIIISPE
ncbi:2132_t:CDS:2, partial [Racocetra persica]